MCPYCVGRLFIFHMKLITVHILYKNNDYSFFSIQKLSSFINIHLMQKYFVKFVYIKVSRKKSILVEGQIRAGCMDALLVVASLRYAIF